MRHARPSAAPAAVARHPNHLSPERAAPEDSVAAELGLVHRLVAEMQPEAAARAQATPHRLEPRLELLADACRLNALVAVKRAGSGHLGSTFSALDVVTQLLFEELDVAQRGFDDPDRDVFFSSKGHDAPALYAVLIGLGRLPYELVHRLRRLGGLPGHPDLLATPEVVTNTGSLGYWSAP